MTVGPRLGRRGAFEPPARYVSFAVPSPPYRPKGAPRMRFVGRGPELAALGGEAAAAAQGRCRVVLIHGVDGVGKSRLLDEFATLADRDGFRHIRVTGRISADSPPDWPWRQALAALDAPS